MSDDRCGKPATSQTRFAKALFPLAATPHITSKSGARERHANRRATDNSRSPELFALSWSAEDAGSRSAHANATLARTSAR